METAAYDSCALNAEDTAASSVTEPVKPEYIQKYSPENVHGEVIGKIVCGFLFISENAPIDDFADELGSLESAEALGVVDDTGAVRGIILRKDFSDLLSQRFGRDIYRNKPASVLMKDVRTIDSKRNIYGIAEELSAELNVPRTTYYVLTSEGNRFAGIFSTRDLNIYLARMLQKDMALAKRIQTGIVRDVEQRECSRLSMIGATRMAKGIGGDFYSVSEYSPGRWLVNISDVSGKGMPASLVSVLLGGMFSLYDFTQGLDPFIVKLNSFLHKSFGGDRFVTSSFLDIDAGSGEMSVFDLGHSYLFIVRDGTVIRVRSKGNNIPLGISGECVPEKGKVSLLPGDLVVLCTDGFEEQKDPEGNEYGLSRFFRMILRNRDRGLVAAKQALFEDVDAFRKNQPGSDDMTIVMIEYK